MEQLLAAERRGRALLFAAAAAAGKTGALEFDIADDTDGHALLAAARAAPCLGKTVDARLASPESPSDPWRLLLPGCLRFANVPPGTPARSVARAVPEQGDPIPIAIPGPEAAWTVPLAESRPRVRPDDGVSPALTRAQSRDIDRRAVEEFSVPGLCLMENAAVAAVTVALDMLSGPGRHADARVLVVAGGGNNGGDGFAMARGFARLGFKTEVALLKPARLLTGDALVNRRLLENEAAPVRELANHPEFLESMLDGATLVVDALLGTGFTGKLSPAYHEAITRINRAGRPVLAVDIPSGLDGDSGEVVETAVRAERTITFAAVKTGLRADAAKPWAGEVFVGDIGFAAGD